MNVYLTGDTHGRFERITCFCRDNHTTLGDVLIILGDAGVNYYLDHRDEKLKRYIDTMPVTLLCIHGNHEARPTAALGYEEAERFGARVMVQPEHPNLLFALDGEVYELAGRSCIAIGGAYSIDKEYRLLRGAAWWPDEQPSAGIKRRVERALAPTQAAAGRSTSSSATPRRSATSPPRPSCPSSTRAASTRALSAGWTKLSTVWTTTAGTPGIFTPQKRWTSCG